MMRYLPYVTFSDVLFVVVVLAALAAWWWIRPRRG